MNNLPSEIEINGQKYFRAKPEPKTIWVNEYECGRSTYDTEGEALDATSHKVISKAVEYQEAIK